MDMQKKQSQQPPERIESLKKSLYTKHAPSVQRGGRHGLSPDEDAGAPKDWQHENSINFDMGRVSKKGNFATKLLLGALGFFVIALGITAYFFFGGVNIISSDNVDIEITAPPTIEGGEEVAFDVEIQNNNNVALQSVLVIVEYPNGTRSSEDTSVILPRERETIGDIAVNQNATRTFKAVLFGAEGEEQEVKVSIEYRVQGSNAIFSKEKTYPVLISGAPVRLTVNAPTEVVSDQTFRTSVTVTSNATEVIEDVLLVAELPFGFSISNATPKASFGTNVWSLGDLAPGSSRTINLDGAIRGQDGEERTVRFTAGIQPDRDRRTISTPLITAIAPMKLTAPFITTGVTINGSSGETVALASSNTANVTIVWENNLPTSLSDASIEVRFGGGGYDPRSVVARDGFYDSGRNAIVWDGRTEGSLNRIRPGDSGSVTFALDTLGYEETGAWLENPEVTFDVIVKAVRDGGGSTPDIVTTNAARTIKVRTEADVLATISHGGQFSDTGPIPPKVGETTTYTVTWEIKNTINDITNARVRTTLPPYVNFTNIVFPNTEDVRYDTNSRTITWDAGTVRRGAGVFGDSRTVSFQIAFTPTLQHVGDDPQLIGDTTFGYRDSHTETSSGESLSPRTTKLPGFNKSQSDVVE